MECLLTFSIFPLLQGQYSHLVLLAAFDCIDDTKLVKQIIISVSTSSGLELRLLTSCLFLSLISHMLYKHFDIFFLSIFSVNFLVLSFKFYF